MWQARSLTNDPLLPVCVSCSCPSRCCAQRRVTPWSDAGATGRAWIAGCSWGWRSPALLCRLLVLLLPAGGAEERRDVQRPPGQLRLLDEHQPARRDLHGARRHAILAAEGVLHPRQHHQVPTHTGRGAREGEGGRRGSIVLRQGQISRRRRTRQGQGRIRWRRGTWRRTRRSRWQ